MKLRFGILTVSDSCSEGQAIDKCGPLLEKLLTTQQAFSAETIKNIVPDEKRVIEEALKRWCDDDMKMDVVLTTGGTGFSHRDVTPEATKNVLHREAPGIAMAMMITSLDITPLAMLSRCVVGTRGNTLIINLPGSPKGAIEMVTAALPGIPHAVSLMKNDQMSVKAVHSALQASGHHHHHHRHCHSKKSTVDLSQVARRNRESPYPMKSMDEAVSLMLQISKSLFSTEVLPLSEALNHVTVEPVKAADDLPPFRASVKDGYAVLASDGAGLRQVVGHSFAGNQSEVKTLKSGECMRVTTGAPVPAGADAVVQVEDTKLVKEADGGKTEIEIEILQAPALGQDIRPVGSDMKMGEVVVDKNSVLHAPQIGLIAAAGVAQVQVFRLPRVAVFSTGDEVQDAGISIPPRRGCIYDSNRPMLLSLIKQHGFPVFDLGIIKDDPSVVLSKLKEALSNHDVIVTSGGVSMGEKDYLKEVLVKDLGAHIHFGRVLMKPGKPTTFASLEIEGKPRLVFALPGNPVSAAVCCHLFTLPALRTIAGHSTPTGFNITAKLGSKIWLDPRPEYCRAVLQWPKPPSAELPIAHLTGSQASSRLLSMQTATVLLEFPAASESQKMLPAGSLVTAILLNIFN